ncbi:olfactory receptor 10A3-like [Pygocentrus nattereri]|uniref:olfactory receptor 10A3-like n=1 Tax=Pygocentrus nattereri TaxID=42514 RepID=UPI0008144DA0|nr:olfactory receptor 10A3-like [Pygocentrus nattereri]
MENFSKEFVFVLHGLNDSKTNKHIYFAFGLVIYIVTLFVNFTLIITIILSKTLHEPMYLFICNLYVNGICGASAFYPKILADLFSDSHVISYTGCLIQIYIIYCYIFCELTCLTAMAYDRYVAICKPLEYHNIMTHQKVVNLLVFIWFFSILEISVGTALTSQLRLCGNDIDKLYCFNWDVVKLSCTDVTVNNVYGYIVIFTHVFQAVLIIISYIRIVRASMKSKTERVKFMQTCIPHLITLMNFTISLLLDLMCARYGKGQELQALRNILGIEFLVVPPLLNPIIYGLKMTQIRRQLVKMYNHRLKAVQQN